jgi:ribose transport system substrate-binding protein
MKKFALSAGCAVLALGILAGCSSAKPTTGTGAPTGGSTGGTVPAAATDLIKIASQPQPWQGPLSGPLGAKNKFVVSIPCGLAARGCARFDVGVKAAAKVLGWRVLTIDPNFDPNKANAAIRQAISLKADAIAVGAVDPALIKNSIAAARSAGIVVVQTGDGHDFDPLTPDGVNYDVGMKGPTAGQWEAAKICSDLGAKGKVMMLEDKQFQILEQRIDNAVSWLKDNCPAVKTDVKLVTATDVGTVIQSKVKALLASNPDVGALLVAGDPPASDIIPMLRETQSKVRLYACDAGEQIIASIKAGGPVAATVGSAVEMAGWAQMDNINRLLQGASADKANQVVQIRLITADYTPPNGVEYDGDVDFATKYTQLWQTGKTTA